MKNGVQYVEYIMVPATLQRQQAEPSAPALARSLARPKGCTPAQNRWGHWVFCARGRRLQAEFPKKMNCTRWLALAPFSLTFLVHSEV